MNDLEHNAAILALSQAIYEQDQKVKSLGQEQSAAEKHLHQKSMQLGLEGGNLSEMRQKLWALVCRRFPEEA